MEAVLIEQLLITYGPTAINFITGIIAKIEAKGTVSLAEWTTLTSSLNMTAKDLMKTQLIAAGIDPASPQGVAMLNAAQ